MNSPLIESLKADLILAARSVLVLEKSAEKSTRFIQEAMSRENRLIRAPPQHAFFFDQRLGSARGTIAHIFCRKTPAAIFRLPILWDKVN